MIFSLLQLGSATLLVGFLMPVETRDSRRLGGSYFAIRGWEKEELAFPKAAYNLFCFIIIALSRAVCIIRDRIILCRDLIRVPSGSVV